jgi:hypothetical protein
MFNFQNFDSFVLNEALNISEIRPYYEIWKVNRGKERYAEWFGGKWRIYLDILNQASDVQIEVEEALEENGYYIVDYHANKAGKYGDKRDYSVGKLLNRFNKSLTTAYAKDKDVTVDSDYKIVISRHVYDIVGMTTERRWHNLSCMNSRTGGNKHYIKRDIEHGTIVAYVIKKDDTNINDPINRLLIKPFYNDDDEMMLGTDRVYCDYNKDKEISNFRETVNKWLESKQGSIEGKYYLHDSIYDDGIDTLEPTDYIAKKLKRQYKEVYKEHDKYYLLVDSFLDGDGSRSYYGGIADLDGNVILPVKYSNNMEYVTKHNAIIVVEDNKYGVFSLDENKMVIEPKYFKILVVYNQICIYKDRSTFSILRSLDENDIVGTYNSINRGRLDNEFVVGIDNKKGLLVDLKEVLPVEYDYIKSQNIPGIIRKDGEYQIQKNNKIGIFSVTKGMLIPVEFDGIESYSDLGFMLKKDDIVGFVDLNFKTIIPIENGYNRISPVEDGVYDVIKNRKHGIFTDGKEVIVPNLSTFINYYTKLSDEYFLVSSLNQFNLLLVNRNGDKLFPLDYADIRQQQQYKSIELIRLHGANGYATNIFRVKATKSNLSGIYSDKAKKLIIPVEYTAIDRLGDIYLCYINKTTADIFDINGNKIQSDLEDIYSDEDSNYTTGEVYFKFKTQDGKTLKVNSTNGNIE